MSENYIRALGLPEEKPPQPEKSQIKMELARSGVLIWFLFEMQEEMEGYERNILYADTANSAAIVSITQWQAKRAVLEQWLGRLVELTTETQGEE